MLDDRMFHRTDLARQWFDRLVRTHTATALALGEFANGFPKLHTVEALIVTRFPSTPTSSLRCAECRVPSFEVG